MIATCRGVRIAGIASAVPADVVTAEETGRVMGATPGETSKITRMTGVKQRHVAPRGLCTSDMAAAAAERLLSELNWDRNDIQNLVFVTQTADYNLPATACLLQSRLGLNSECAALDVSLGCSGYVYGLWLCSSLIASGSVRRALLLAGDTSTWLCSPNDRSTAFLFGDAGTATALEAAPDAPPMQFVLGTDGGGENYLIQPGSGYRHPCAPGDMARKPDESGRLRSPLDLHMEGSEVFRFTMERVPPMLEQVLAASGSTIDDVAAFVPHQANRYMLQVLCEQMRIPMDKLALSLGEYGNTSSASIPLTCSYALAAQLRKSSSKLLLAGFGVGWSWGAAMVTCGPMVMPEILHIGSQQSSPENAK